MWAIVSALIEGLVLGVIARLLIPGKQDVPLWLTMILGMIGAMIGNGVAHVFGVANTSGIDWWRHLFQLGAAIVVIATVAPLWAGRKQH
ncbi:GlsB/YeaQ/YmgE family stress response membrane protein [Kitasatospora sp. NBC_00240]|uniref:GlsB/YeaQ/YmgE family stress response membrane protein n=1 Tax=Kitasatospora sp. NBC_00240 TaxID=2903567 RepID=UPI00225797A4|nr:GlsB/YeaQ/YmgE family stress response membrane protein [Kitasatospora sp. NBC_00240]MCX5210170.1 GlsB/YeaQ/YmgE family stress response membrane protein [Kitasatospora sp. NBC_00240]